MFPNFILLSFLWISPAFIVSSTEDGSTDNDNMKLIMVHALWRHGDRVPTETYHNDKFTVDYWTVGGGGWGQLSPAGMQQNMEFGQKLRDRYIEGKPYTFLSPRYNQQEVFVRSSDTNRTLLSATATMIGMYGARDGKSYSLAGVDYPAVSDWPFGYVPIPIHTIGEPFDHLLFVDNHCPLQDTIWGLAKKTTIVSEYFKNPEVEELFEELTNYCGEDINSDNLWILFNALKIEKLYYPELFYKMTPWYTDELFAKIDAVNAQVQDFQNGLGLDGVMSNNLDIGKTIKKIRGGTLMNNIVHKMKRKIDCQGKAGKECRYTNNIKFIGFSAHDTTIYAILSLLNISNIVVTPKGYPLYTACVLLELWQDVITNQNFFKMIYHRNENDSLDNVITSAIPGCSGGDFCDLQVLQIFADSYKPDMEMDKWCDFDILKKTALALTSVPSPASTVTLAMGLLAPWMLIFWK